MLERFDLATHLLLLQGELENVAAALVDAFAVLVDALRLRIDAQLDGGFGLKVDGFLAHASAFRATSMFGARFSDRPVSSRSRSDSSVGRGMIVVVLFSAATSVMLCK